MKESYIEIQKMGGYWTHRGKDKQRLKRKKKTYERNKSKEIKGNENEKQNKQWQSLVIPAI